MSPQFLFIACSLIWGSTWIGITYQVGQVSPLLAVGWRFSVAALCLGIWCWIHRLNMRFEAAVHRRMAVVGILMYTLDYSLLYAAQENIISGLLAVLSSCIIYLSVVLRKTLFGYAIRREVVVGATFGLVGIGCIFAPEFAHVAIDTLLLYGLGLAMLSFICAALGSVLAEQVMADNVPVVQMNFFAMTYGVIGLYVTALITGQSFTLPADGSFYVALVYLALFGSILAFGAYMKLVKQLGADKASYVTLVYPLIALLFSTFLEGYQWTASAAFGVVIVLLGNAIAMGRIRFPRRTTRLAG